MDGTAITVVEGLAFFDQGILPTHGGWGEQSAIWWDATVVALNERAEYRRIEQERARRKHEAKRRR